MCQEGYHLSDPGCYWAPQVYLPESLGWMERVSVSVVWLLLEYYHAIRNAVSRQHLIVLTSTLQVIWSFWKLFTPSFIYKQHLRMHPSTFCWSSRKFLHLPQEIKQCFHWLAHICLVIVRPILYPYSIIRLYACTCNQHVIKCPTICCWSRRSLLIFHKNLDEVFINRIPLVLDYM